MSLQADPASLPRLLSGMPVDGAMGLEEHWAIHGETPFAKRRERRGTGALIDLVERAGLLGRGGGAFPAATKMHAVAGARGRPIVLANVAEGEPASDKDRVLMEGLPHLVLDGGVLAARALGADELILCIDESGEAALESATRAIYERERAGGDALKVSVQIVPAGYVSGQESALVNLCNGGQALPAFASPMPFECGVRRRPTLINNAETLAHLALIARYGPEWFRALGTQAHPGSTMLTLSGAITHPGVYEIEQGAPLASLIEAAGGMTGQIRAMLLGGYAGTWLEGGSISTLELSNDRLAAHEASLGAGVVVLLSREACPVAETARVASWLAAQSSGQCGPCVHGLQAIAGAIAQLAAGTASAGTGQRIERWTSMVTGRGACAHPDGVLSFLTSAVNVFAEEFADHARHGPCDACSRAKELPLPALAEMATAA